jgi:transposase-like protein
MNAIATICVTCGTITPDARRGRCEHCYTEWTHKDGQRRQAHPRTAIYANPKWKTAARACLTRDHWACVECGRHRSQLNPNERLSADHTTPVLECLDPYDVDGLRTLCNTCHGAKDGTRAHQ